MSNQQELHTIWRQLATTYQQLNSAPSEPERTRLKALSNMLRIEYRHLTSTYR